MFWKDLTSAEHQAVCPKRLGLSNDGRLSHRSITQAAAESSVSRDTNYKHWKRWKVYSTSPLVRAIVSTWKHSTDKKARGIPELPKRAKATSISHRTCLRSVEIETSISKLTLHRAIRAGSILLHSSSIKPLVTDINKVKQTKFAINNIEYSLHKYTYEFKNMCNYVQVDERCFRVMKDHLMFYLSAKELIPHGTAKSRNFVKSPKFLCAVACLGYNPRTISYFYDKIEVWPLVAIKTIQ